MLPAFLHGKIIGGGCFFLFNKLQSEEVDHKETFKYHMMFFEQFYTPPLCDGILTLSANPSPHMTFSTKLYRERGSVKCELSFFSHDKSYMTVWPNPLLPI